MLNYLLRRALYAILALWAVSIISFFILNLPPGDYVTTYIANLTATGSIVLYRIDRTGPNRICCDRMGSKLHLRKYICRQTENNYQQNRNDIHISNSK